MDRNQLATKYLENAFNIDKTISEEITASNKVIEKTILLHTMINAENNRTINNLNNSLKTIAYAKTHKIDEFYQDANLRKLIDAITKKQAKIILSTDNITYGDKTKFKYKNKNLTEDALNTSVSFSELFSDLSIDDIFHLIETLECRPYLAILDPIGEKVFSGSKNIPEHFFETIMPGSKVYRARIMDEPEIPYTEKEMSEAPSYISPQGRFNTQGIGLFYVSYDAVTAQIEIEKHKKTEGQTIQVAEFQSRERTKVLDLLKVNNTFSKKCLKPVTNIKQFNPEYLLPNFLSQCLHYHNNCDGIMFGTQEQRSAVFFNSKKFNYNGSCYINK